MTQLLRGMLTIGIIAILVFLIVLLYMDLDQPAVEKEECPFAQQDYIYWSKKYKLAWCKVFSLDQISPKNPKLLLRYQRRVPPHGCTTCWCWLEVPLSTALVNPWYTKHLKLQRSYHLAVGRARWTKIMWTSWTGTSLQTTCCMRNFADTILFPRTSRRLKNRPSPFTW